MIIYLYHGTFQTWLLAIRSQKQRVNWITSSWWQRKLTRWSFKAPRRGGESAQEELGPPCLGGPHPKLRTQTLANADHDHDPTGFLLILSHFPMSPLSPLSPSALPLACCRRRWKDSFGSSPPQDQIPGDFSNAPRYQRWCDGSKESWRFQWCLV